VHVLSKAGAEIVPARLNPGAQPHLVSCTRSYWQRLLRGRTRCQQREDGANHQSDLYHRLSHLLGGITASMLSYVLRERPDTQRLSGCPLQIYDNPCVTHSGSPALRRPSINTWSFDELVRATHSVMRKLGSSSSMWATASFVSASRPR
jgi:hypothetical protein